MDVFIKMLLSLSLSGTLLIIILFLSRPLYKNRLSQKWQYYIWLLVIARLLLPFTTGLDITDNLPGQQTYSRNRSAITYKSLDLVKNIPAETVQDKNKISGSSTDNSNAISQYPLKQILYNILYTIKKHIFFIWLIPVLVLFIRKITEYQNFIQYIKAARSGISDLRIWEQLGKLAMEAGIKTNVEIYSCSLISSPLLTGFLRPCIILPTEELPDTDLKNTIRHELIHFKRKDMFYKWLVQVITCLYWFNPFIYILSHETSRLCELSCDEAVIKKLDTNGRREYGDTLLNAIANGNAYKSPSATVTLNEGKKLLKERLDAIMKFKRKPLVYSIISVLFTLLLCVTAAVAGDAIINKNPANSKTTANNTTSKTTDVSGSNKKTEPDNRQASNKKDNKYNYTAIDKYIADGKVISGNNKYYILCNGATKKDIPNGGCVGGIGIEIVEKDGYASIGPSDTDTIVEDVKKTCDKWVKDKVITKKEAGLAIGLAKKVHEENGKVKYIFNTGDNNGYAKWGIKKNDDNYYYKKERVRILFDLKYDNSLKFMNYDKKGTVDLKIKRNKKGKILKVTYLSEKESEKYYIKYINRQPDQQEYAFPKAYYQYQQN